MVLGYLEYSAQWLASEEGKEVCRWEDGPNATKRKSALVAAVVARVVGGVGSGEA